MSWSQSFSLDRSTVVASFHRLAITITVQELLTEPEEVWRERLLGFVPLYVMHVNLVAGEKTNNTLSALRVLDNISKCMAEKSTSTKLFVTLTCPMNSCRKLSEDLISPVDLLMIQIPEGYWVGKKDGETQALLDMLHPNALIRSLGGCGFDNVDSLDVFMQAHQDTPKLRFMGLAINDLPNICSMAIELIHTFRMNCLVSFDANVIDRAQGQELYANLASKYNISPLSLLLKCMLQLGPVLSLPLARMMTSQPALQEEVGRLGHPFVHRKDFVSAFRVISLQISDEDLDAVLASSEEIEMKRDEDRIVLANSTPPPMVFSFVPKAPS